MNTPTERPSRAKAFVPFIIERINRDNGIAAALRRADNPATEYQSWEQLAAFNIALDKDYERLPYATIAAAIAKGKVQANGSTGIGRALANCYDDSANNNQAAAKLRRLLACQSAKEACRVLRPIFSLINAKSNISLDFSRLLSDLLNFHFNSERIKAQWAQDFYSYQGKADDKEEMES